MLIILVAAAASLANPLAPGAHVPIAASGSPNFSLAASAAVASADGATISGRVCRLARSTLMSPQRLRLERVGADSAVAETAEVSLPILSTRVEQRCARYAARVAWRLMTDESLRLCFDRGQPCPAASTGHRESP